MKITGQKGNKWKKWKKTVRKCPFAVSVLATYCLAMLFSKDIGVQAVWKEIPVSRELSEGLDKPQEEAITNNDAKKGQEADGAQANGGNPDGSDKENFQNNAGNLQDNEENKSNYNLTDNGSYEKEEPDSAQNGVKYKENEEAHKRGVTKFEYYTPKEVDSIYYSDAGKVALTTEYDYQTVDESYFDDAAFIGDSRTLGLSDYLGLDNADFYCENSMTIFKVLEDTGVTYQKTGNKVDLKKALQEKKYGKIYIMLGINEYGYGNTQMWLDKYREVVEQIREWQPEAVLFIMANLHMSEEKERTSEKKDFNNININDKNAASATLVNGIDSFYLDCNPLFTDEKGYLNAELTFDGVHLYAQHYGVWRDFLMEHGVVAEK